MTTIIDFVLYVFWKKLGKKVHTRSFSSNILLCNAMEVSLRFSKKRVAFLEKYTFPCLFEKKNNWKKDPQRFQLIWKLFYFKLWKALYQIIEKYGKYFKKINLKLLKLITVFDYIEKIYGSHDFSYIPRKSR